MNVRARPELSTGIRVGPPVVASVSGAHTVDPGTDLVLADATSAGFTVTLPAATNVELHDAYTVKAVNVTGGSVVVAAAGSDTIDGAASKSLDTAHAMISVVSDGTAWRIVAQMGTVT